MPDDQKITDLLKENLPAELRGCTRWVLWRLEDTPSKDGKPGRERCKVPKNCSDPKVNASSTGPKSWGTFDQALENLTTLKPVERYQAEENSVGVGLTFGAPYFGVDLDKCFDAESGYIELWAAEILRKFPPTYTELSPSRKGFHLWYRCAEHPKLPDGIRTEKAEIYSRGRYFTMTGLPHGTPCELADIPLTKAMEMFRTIEALKESSKQEEKPCGSDKLRDYLTRTDFPDRSAAVQSLLTQLFIEHGDPAKVEEVFKTSALYRETHWAQKWERLREKELVKAENFARNARREKPKVEWELVVADENARPEKSEWLWKPWLEIPSLVLAAGDSGEGKSPAWIDIAARMTSGGKWPDDEPIGKKLGVVHCGIEDNYFRRTLPRFLAAGGDQKLLRHIKGVTPKGSGRRASVIALDESAKLVQGFLQQEKDAGREYSLLIIDPITNHLGKMKYTDHQQVREVMNPLIDLTDEFKLVTILVNHFNRQKDAGRVQYRILGAGFYQVCRSVIVHARHPAADPEVDRYLHYISEDRNKEAESLAYRTVKSTFTYEGETFDDIIRIEWLGVVEASSEGSVEDESPRDRGLAVKAAAVLVELLKENKDGELMASGCMAGIKDRLPEIGEKFKWDRVRRQAKVGTRKNGKKNVWYLKSSSKGKLF